MSPTGAGIYETTGPEIYDDLDGQVDGFVSAVGSGGHARGRRHGDEGARPEIKIALADPMGAALYSFYTTGELKSAGSSITEGIGQGRVTANLEGAPVDFAYQIPTRKRCRSSSTSSCRRDCLLGGSSGINIAGAIRLARELGPGHTIVTLLCDFGARYASKLFNPAFLRSKNLPVPDWLEAQGARAGGVRLMTEASFAATPICARRAQRWCSPRRAGSPSTARSFMRRGGGQPGDRGALVLDDGATIPIVDTVYDADQKTILHVPVQGAALPAPGRGVIARIDWDLALSAHARHTALHLLSVVLPYPVTGGSVGDGEGRLDFD